MESDTGIGRYTLWLLPCADDEIWLKDLIESYAREFETERFLPHVTLLTGLSASAENAHENLRRVADAMPAVDARIAEIGFLPEIFRAFFLRLELHGELQRMYERSTKLGSIYPLDTFMPHVSLIYGELELDAKRTLAARLRAELGDRTVRLDRLAYVYSGKGIPVADWRIDFDVDLA